MKHISKIATVSSFSIAREEKNEQETLNPLSCQLVDKIFGSFLLLCRGFDNLYSDINRLKAEKTRWFIYFTKNKITTIEQIQHGLNKLDNWTYPNPPQLGLFIDWCTPTPQDLGFPTTNEAYLISIRMNVQFSDYKHPDQKINTLIKHVINQIGTTAYREMKSELAQKTFEYNYIIALRQYMNGELKEINKALEDNSSQTEEIIKSKGIVKDEYKEIRSSSSAMSAIKNLLK